jgi:3-deoxy-manno-octulosonate cytidylyltransferase (CMP-KDO synthetase)
MVMRVYQQAKEAKLLDDVIVATDDQRIFDEVFINGGNVVMTSVEHRNGTERCAEVASGLDTDYIINIQGDEPYIKPDQIDILARKLNHTTQLATLIKKEHDQQLLKSPSVIKVVKTANNEAIYFSRSPIPFNSRPLSHWYKHIGIYAYRKDILIEIVKLPPSELELSESLEQLRWIENGYRVQLAETELESHSIDTPEDLQILNLT